MDNSSRPSFLIGEFTDNLDAQAWASERTEEGYWFRQMQVVKLDPNTMAPAELRETGNTEIYIAMELVEGRNAADRISAPHPTEGAFVHEQGAEVLLQDLKKGC